MTKFRNLSGIKVKNTATDLPANANHEGEIFYNTAEAKVKFVKKNLVSLGDPTQSTWSTKTNYPNTTGESNWGFGKQNSVTVGAQASPYTEGYSWNGSAWSVITDIGTGRYQTGGGFGADEEDGGISRGRAGAFTPSSFKNNFEIWNGSTWTESTETNNQSGVTRGSWGLSSSAGMTVGSDSSVYSPRQQAHVEVWNGSSWTESAEFSPADTSQSNGFGSSSSGVQIGDQNDNPQSWNGSSWSSIPAMTSQRESNNSSGKDEEDGIVITGYRAPNYLSTSEHWNGTAWSEQADITEARSSQKHSSNNASSECLVVTGYDGSAPTNSVEEFAGPSAGSYTITDIV